MDVSFADLELGERIGVHSTLYAKECSGFIVALCRGLQCINASTLTCSVETSTYSDAESAGITR
jgi:hypothetical protein